MHRITSRILPKIEAITRVVSVWNSNMAFYALLEEYDDENEGSEK